MNKYKILVVEDDLYTSDMLRLYFEAQEYEVLTAARGRDALEICQKTLPNLILQDIRLPDIDGYEVCKRLRDNLRTSHIPFIFLTDRVEREDKIAGFELGADDYITKPFDVEELKLRVQNALARTSREGLLHPVTGLPRGKLTEEQLERLLFMDSWAILYIGLGDFGFLDSDKILHFTATVIKETVDGLGTPDDFIGHTTGNDFVIVTIAEKAQAIKAKVTERFAAEQVPLMTLAVSVITQDDGPFADIRDIMEKAATGRSGPYLSRILFVEDDLDIANMLCTYFDSQGYEVFTAAFGGDALEICHKKLPNVVVLDIMLPDMDGYEVCKKLRSNLRTSHIPIMFLTQKDKQADKIAGLELGADDYITKPFDIEELKLRIQNTVAWTTRESLTNPVTGLPSGKLIEEQLRLLVRKGGWAILYIGLKGFRPFNEVYGYVVGDDVLRFTAMLIGEAVDELGTPDDFIGHAAVSDFIVITLKRAQAIKEKVVDRFVAEVGTFYNFKYREQGYITITDTDDQEKQVPLMTLAVGVITQDDGPFADAREITERVAEARREDERR